MMNRLGGMFVLSALLYCLQLHLPILQPVQGLNVATPHHGQTRYQLEVGHRRCFGAAGYQYQPREGRVGRGSALLSQTGSDSDADRDKPSTEDLSDVPTPIHHAALRTRNITTAIDFYSLLGFRVETKFRAGPAKAAWLTSGTGEGVRFELIEIPDFILQEPEGMKRRAIDLSKRSELLGWNHVALDVTAAMDQCGFTALEQWMDQLNKKSKERFGKSLRVAVRPKQTIIGQGVYELAFLYDADGGIVELIRKQTELKQKMDSGWNRISTERQ